VRGLQGLVTSLLSSSRCRPLRGRRGRWQPRYRQSVRSALISVSEVGRKVDGDGDIGLVKLMDSVVVAVDVVVVHAEANPMMAAVPLRSW
jgi:hypothetical protein